MIETILSLLFVIAISIMWANGIVNMDKEHKDYDGSDFLN